MKRGAWLSQKIRRDVSPSSRLTYRKPVGICSNRVVILSFFSFCFTSQKPREDFYGIGGRSARWSLNLVIGPIAKWSKLTLSLCEDVSSPARGPSGIHSHQISCPRHMSCHCSGCICPVCAAATGVWIPHCRDLSPAFFLAPWRLLRKRGRLTWEEYSGRSRCCSCCDLAIGGGLRNTAVIGIWDGLGILWHLGLELGRGFEDNLSAFELLATMGLMEVSCVGTLCCPRLSVRMSEVNGQPSLPPCASCFCRLGCADCCFDGHTVGSLHSLLSLDCLLQPLGTQCGHNKGNEVIRSFNNVAEANTRPIPRSAFQVLSDLFC